MRREGHPSVTPGEAFSNAVERLQSGNFDNRTAEGAQVNALESIAWSLIALIGKDTLLDQDDADVIRDTVERMGLMSKQDMQ